MKRLFYSLTSPGVFLIGRLKLGRLGALLASVHSSVADGQVIHPLLVQISIEPSWLTLQPQRAPVAVISMH